MGLRIYVKLQVVFFDNDGHVTMVEESQKRKTHSEANLYIVPFARLVNHLLVSRVKIFKCFHYPA